MKKIIVSILLLGAINLYSNEYKPDYKILIDANTKSINVLMELIDKFANGLDNQGQKLLNNTKAIEEIGRDLNEIKHKLDFQNQMLIKHDKWNTAIGKDLTVVENKQAIIIKGLQELYLRKEN